MFIPVRVCFALVSVRTGSEGIETGDGIVGLGSGGCFRYVLDVMGYKGWVID